MFLIDIFVVMTIKSSTKQTLHGTALTGAGGVCHPWQICRFKVENCWFS